MQPGALFDWLALQDVEFEYGRESTIENVAPVTFGNITTSLEVVFLNSAVDATGAAPCCVNAISLCSLQHHKQQDVVRPPALQCSSCAALIMRPPGMRRSVRVVF